MRDTSGPPSLTLFAYFDPDTSSWRKCQDSLLSEDWISSRPTWPKWGTWDAGAAYELPTLVPPTVESGCSSLLNTPTVEEAGRVGSQEWADRWAAGEVIPSTQRRLRTQVKALLPTPNAGNFNDGEDVDHWLARRDEQKARHNNGNGMGTPLAIAVRLLPTPTVWEQGSDSKWDERIARLKEKGINGNGAGMPLSLAVQRLLPTPTVDDSANVTRESGEYQSLTRTARLLPTPRSQNGEDRNNKIWFRPDGQPQNLENALARLPTPRATRGAPSPETVQMLSGEPTDQQLSDGSESLDDQLRLL